MVHADVGSCGDQEQESWKLPGLSPLSASPSTQRHFQEVCDTPMHTLAIPLLFITRPCSLYNVDAMNNVGSSVKGQFQLICIRGGSAQLTFM